jgi:hypothetical protein
MARLTDFHRQHASVAQAGRVELLDGWPHQGQRGWISLETASQAGDMDRGARQ